MTWLGQCLSIQSPQSFIRLLVSLLLQRIIGRIHVGCDRLDLTRALVRDDRLGGGFNDHLLAILAGIRVNHYRSSTLRCRWTWTRKTIHSLAPSLAVHREWSWGLRRYVVKQRDSRSRLQR